MHLLIILSTLFITVLHISSYLSTRNEKIPLSLICGCLLISVLEASLISEYRISDGVEYLTMARSFVKGDGFTINIADQIHPSRYTIWFSLFYLTPFYLFSDWLSAPWIGFAILGLLCSLSAWQIGSKIGLKGGALMALLFLNLNSGYRYFIGNSMTEIPTVLLLLLLLNEFLSDRPKSDLRVGLLIGTLFSLRPTSLAVITPFIIKLFKKERLNSLNFLYLLLPSLAFMVGNLVYNQLVFGSFWRSGYHYWLSVPYDYSWLTFSINFLTDSLAKLRSFSELLFFAGIIIFCSRVNRFKTLIKHRTKPFNVSCVFVVITTLPVALFYLSYFYATERFYLPFTLLLVTIIGGCLGSYAPESFGLKSKLLSGLVLLTLAITAYLRPRPIQQELARLNNILVSNQRNCTIIAKHNPLIVESELGCRVIPSNRKLEYASKVVTPIQSKERPPLNLGSFEHRNSWLLEHGSKEVYNEIADNIRAIEKTTKNSLVLEFKPKSKITTVNPSL